MSITKQDLLDAFPYDKAWTDIITGIPPEIIDIQRSLQGKRWTEIPPDLCNNHTDVYIMLDAPPLAYFIPAFLFAAIDDPSNNTGEFLVYNFCSGHIDKLHPLLDPTQRDLLIGVVAELLTDDEDSFGSHEKLRFTKRLSDWSSR